jgi:hypothetical protein
MTRLAGREGVMFSLTSVVGKCGRGTFSLSGGIVASYFILWRGLLTSVFAGHSGVRVQRAGMPRESVRRRTGRIAGGGTQASLCSS